MARSTSSLAFGSPAVSALSTRLKSRQSSPPRQRKIVRKMSFFHSGRKLPAKLASAGAAERFFLTAAQRAARKSALLAVSTVFPCGSSAPIIAAGVISCAWTIGILATQNIEPSARVVSRTAAVFAIRAGRCSPLDTMSNFFIKRRSFQVFRTVLGYRVRGGRSTKFSLLLPKKRVKGIEPSSVAWKATALPLSYTREIAKLARSRRPAKSFSTIRSATFSSLCARECA